ncbi:hypothetical protein AZE42_04944 [Rhizopogon vesiculosus]|uniref:F-box domain-containing protein n=1 Tax=Rhizopogon vesiculosus TaxID=180088 RepID=A0A1J8PUJ9_9AGAM|nr:hypothetical protein AZE42_04944 [Rhizopogon vesiculosus]
MSPYRRFPFPTELGLLILTYAGRPTFTQTGSHATASNIYSSAMALCRVSRAVRRAVLPQVLHTVVLFEKRNVKAFVRALRMQRAYAKRGSDLHFDYADCIRRIWIGEISAGPRFISFFTLLCRSASDISLLAPVLLAAESLSIDYAGVFLLEGCLSHVWESRNMNTNHIPWSTKTLTLRGHSKESHFRKENAATSAFIASIPYVICLFPPETTIVWTRRSGGDLEEDALLSFDKLPAWVEHTRMPHWKSLQTITFAWPHLVDSVTAWLVNRRDAHVELLKYVLPVHGWGIKEVEKGKDDGA